MAEKWRVIRIDFHEPPWSSLGPYGAVSSFHTWREAFDDAYNRARKARLLRQHRVTMIYPVASGD